MTDMIRRKLDDAKRRLEQMEKLNRAEPVVRKTESKMPPIPEPTDIKPSQDRVGYVVEPGPKMRKKWKQVWGD